MRILITFPPGGTSGIRCAAFLADALLGEECRPQFLVEPDRTGAGKQLPADLLQKEPPDGYTLILANDAPTPRSAPTQVKKTP